MFEISLTSLRDVIPYVGIVLASTFYLWCCQSIANVHGGFQLGLARGEASVGLEPGDRKRRTNLIPILSWLAPVTLILFQGSRVGVGTDTPTYLNTFNGLPENLTDAFSYSEQEPFYILMSWAVKAVGGDERGYLLVASALTVVPVYLAVRNYRYSARAFMYYGLLGFYLSGFNLMRQSIAVALVLLGYSLLTAGSRRQKILGVIILASAAGFHYSAALPSIAILVIYLVPKTLRLLAVVVTVIVVLGLYISGILFQLSDLAGYGVYLQSGEQGIGALASLLAFATLGCIVLWKTRSDQGPVTSIYFIGLVCLLFGLSFVIVGRLSFYFLVIILIPIAQSHRLTLGKVQGASLFILGLITYVGRVLEFGELLPYSSWL